jgi:hypothetical protein
MRMRRMRCIWQKWERQVGLNGKIRQTVTSCPSRTQRVPQCSHDITVTEMITT